MPTHRVTDAEIARYHEDGYLIVPGLFGAEEMDLLLKIAKADREMNREAKELASGEKRNFEKDKLIQIRDASGAQTKLWLSNDLEVGVYSAIVRSRRIVETMETLIGDEVYHYHHKMMLKEPRVGGAWEWHQDYGYWYDNGCLFPDMASCMIAVDRATRENGCLQVIRGSHKMGRVSHGLSGSQTGADLERVNAALGRMEHVHVELNPGDALFFHGNTLHRSDRNESDRPRWSLICCYNARRNDPYKDSHHPRYSPLEKWDDARVLETARAQWAQLETAAAR